MSSAPGAIRAATERHPGPGREGFPLLVSVPTELDHVDARCRGNGAQPRPRTTTPSGELADATGDPRFAFDSYRRLVQMFGIVVLGASPETFEQRVAGAMALAGVDSESSLGVSELQLLVANFKSLLEQRGTRLPAGPARPGAGGRRGRLPQLELASRSRTYRGNERPSRHDLGLAVIVQQMVFGNRDERSGLGPRLQPQPDHR